MSDTIGDIMASVADYTVRFGKQPPYVEVGPEEWRRIFEWEFRGLRATEKPSRFRYYGIEIRPYKQPNYRARRAYYGMPGRKRLEIWYELPAA
jgi:hypothetical protein